MSSIALLFKVHIEKSMSLYDDEDDIIDKAKDTKVAAGWSQGIKLMQSQLQLKKTNNKTPKGRDIPRSKTAVLAPVMDLKKSSKGNEKSNDDIFESKYSFTADKPFQSFRSSDTSLIPLDPNVKLEREYDPLWPNDYEKVVKEMRDKKRSDNNGVESRSEEQEDSPPEKKRRYLVNNRDKARERFNASDQGAAFVGFGGRPASPEDEERPGLDSRPIRRNNGSGGAAIAPPPSLTESSVSPPPEVSLAAKTPAKQTGLGIAAKIMAKYGYKEGGGLGKSEQGMAKALVVEKTSKRGGRILKGEEIEETPPPGQGGAAIPPPACLDSSTIGGVPAPIGVVGVVSEYGGEEDDIRPPSEFDGSPQPPPEAEPEKPKPSITDMMKNPSKVVLCKNMVGPGEVDEELEPEVMDECGGKYGDVNKVTIVEVADVCPEETVRIFIEFKRVESAIKALVDLNGRFFGGREVQATFYNLDKFLNSHLND